MILESIKVGDFRTRATIQVPVRPRGADGSYTVAWANLRDVWCSFIPLDNPTRPARQTWSSEGREFQFAGQQRGQQKWVVTIRAQPEKFTTTWRLVRGSDVFNVTEAMLISQVQKMVRLTVIENLSQKDSAVAAYNIVVDSTGKFLVDSNGSYIVAKI